MTDENPLEALSRRCGIESSYVDVWGERHEITPETRRAVLAAMGHPAHDEDALGEAMRELEERSWRRPLPPVLVVRQDAGVISVPITMPVAETPRSSTWRMRLECGEDRSGVVDFGGGAVSSRRAIDGQRFERHSVEIAGGLPCGYHQFACEACPETLSMIVTPATAYQPPVLSSGRRVWGPAAQLYGLRSRRDWGIGDYTDLRRLVEIAATAGASLVGLNPLHALFPHEPERASPYSPSSRLFLNTLAIDPEAVPDFAECREARALADTPAHREQRRRLREAALVDYAGVAALKQPVFEQLWRHFRETHLRAKDERARAFATFRDQGGVALWRHAVYQALQEDLTGRDPRLWGWPVWPAGLRDPLSNDVARFAREHEERIGYYLYLQWEADRQLGQAAGAASGKALEIGLYQDLAIAGDRAGSEAWSNQGLYAEGASVGAPPDDFSPLGQNWGLPPYDPIVLRERRYEPFVALLRATMRHAGALRIDHAMGLMRLFWIPRGMPAGQGAYVRYPFADLLGILALESRRNRCLVIGEDLGTVPADFSASLQKAGVQSYRLLFFERTAESAFRPPSDYPRQAAVAVSTHDLPTLRGFWKGCDIEERARLGLFTDADQERSRRERRAADRARLIEALEREGLAVPGTDGRADRTEDLDDEWVRAVHAFLARTPAAVMMVQLDDVLREEVQVNMPGTTTERPNWRRKLGLELATWADGPAWRALAEVIRNTRGG